MHGNGVMDWPDGKHYEGSFFEDKKHGHGRIEWTDGRIYEGEWKNNIQDGKGRYKNKYGEWV